MGEFSGFSSETIDFLWELRMNNSKEWMEENRARYKAALKEPFDLFAPKLGAEFYEKTKEGMDWSVSRINRDTRYSKDKSPYRACRWVVLREPLIVGTEWKMRPAFYFELSPEGYTHGMGIYETTPSYLRAYREKIQNNPKAFAEIITRIAKKNEFTLMGEDYKKVDASGLIDVIQPWFVKRNFHVTQSKPLEEVVFTEDLPKMIAGEWAELLPLYRFLKEVRQD